jgi:hypothetical protein
LNSAKFGFCVNGRSPLFGVQGAKFAEREFFWRTDQPIRPRGAALCPNSPLRKIGVITMRAIPNKPNYEIRKKSYDRLPAAGGSPCHRAEGISPGLSGRTH